MKDRILITGGAGFIGSHLTRKLLNERDNHVTVVDNFDDFYAPQCKRENIQEFLSSSDFTLFESDIRDADGLNDVFETGRFDAIVHLAAKAGVRPSLEQPQLYAETNINGTLNLLECARDYESGKFVFGSSSSVYGARSEVPFTESDDVSHPISPYAATKIAGEVLCHTYNHLYDIPTVCLRFFTVYGACQRPDLAIHKFSKLISDGVPIPMYGDGTSRRDYTYVDDITQGICAAIDYDETPFEIFNLGESRTIELRELIRLLEEKLGVEAVIDRMPMQPGDVPLTCADISKSREKLGYDPVTQIEDGLDEFVAWFNERQSMSSKVKA